MVLVLVDHITNRAEYTFDFIFRERSLEYKLVSSVFEFEKSDIAQKLNYSTHEIENSKQIYPSLLLQQASIIPVALEKVKTADGFCLSFDGQKDIVSSIFYVLSRYEEYVCNEFDMHGRFPFKKSVLNKFDWIEQAICDRWAKEVIEFINPDLYIEFTLANSLTGCNDFVPTFDIDNAYAYKYKVGQRKLLSTFKDLLKFDTGRLSERNRVNAGDKDPYDTYDKISDIAKEYPKTKVFWLTESNGEKDRNVDIQIPEIGELLKVINASCELGIHPSYKSYKDSKKVKSEIGLLSERVGEPIIASRNHFLRFSIKDTFEQLIEAGIKHEYSLGFAEQVGFRSGTARAHKWFNLNKDEVTELTLHPFVYMDGTLNEYMSLSIEGSKTKIKELYDEVATFGGSFIFIWHNETIGDYGKWKGWSEVLDFTLKLNK